MATPTQQAPAHDGEAGATATQAPLFSDACDRVVVVEDASDELYLLWWMEKLLPAERWDRVSRRRFCLYAERRPTPDEVNQRLATIKQIHPEEHSLQPRAFVLADRDYRLDEELETEQRKRQGKDFRHQQWHVWKRAEIENYLICPEALGSFIVGLVTRAASPTSAPAADEAEVRMEVERAIEASQEAVRFQLIDSFARWSKDTKKGWNTSTVVQRAEQFLGSVWQGDGRLDWCDAKEEVLPRLRDALKRRWNVAFSERDLVRSLAPDEVPAEVAQVVHQVAAFLEGSRWIGAEEGGGAGIKPLSEALKNAAPVIRRSAAEALGAKGHRAVPALQRALKDEDVEVRREAAWGLVKIGDKAAPATRTLAEALADADAEVRQRAAMALGQIGQPAREAVPALLQALEKDGAWAVRQCAASALGRIGEAEHVVQALIKALEDPDTNVRIAAAEGLGRLGPAAAGAVPNLLAALKYMTEGREGLRQYAAFALGKIGQATADVLQALTVALKDHHRDPRRFAARALGDLGRGAEATTSAVVEALADEEASIREDAAEALGKIRAPVAQVVPALVRGCKDEDWHVRRGAAEALGRIGPKAVEAAAQLEEMAGDDASGLVRVAAAVALAKVRGRAELAVPVLVGQLKAADVSAQIAAAKALPTIGTTAVAAVPTLMDVLRDGDWRARLAAAEALAALGPEAAQATSALAAALVDDYQDNATSGMMRYGDGPVYDVVRHLAAVALGKVGPAARAALPALREAFRYQRAVSEAAAEAVLHIEQPQEGHPAEV